MRSLFLVLVLLLAQSVWANPTSILSTTADTVLEGNSSESYFSKVAFVGDLNGDGYEDVAVGASNYSNGQNYEGAVFIYLGSSSGLATIPTITLEGNGYDVGLGASVASAGDVNGDGYDDLIVGAPYWGSTNEGKAYLYLGSNSGLSTTPSVTFFTNVISPNLGGGNEVAGRIGASVANCDVNSDGYSDLLIGVPGYFDPVYPNIGAEGAVFVYLGSSAGVSGVPTTIIDADVADAEFGSSVACAGDVNNDGYEDIIAGAPEYRNGQNAEGAMFVYLGSSSGVSTSPQWQTESDKTYAELGVSVSGAGDVNNDGYSDVIVGARYFGSSVAGGQYGSGQYGTNEGKVWVYFGSASGITDMGAWQKESDRPIASFGSSVAGAGDVNADGYDDVIIGSSGYTDGDLLEGAAFVYLGSSSGLSSAAAWQQESNVTSTRFGSRVAGGGDINNDGLDDVLVGASEYTNGQEHEGAAFVYLAHALVSTPTPTATSTPTATITPPVETVFISAKAGKGGTISPSGKIPVAKGSDASFEISPIIPAQYEINNVKVDGVSLGAITSYTFSDVEIKHKIQAIFKVRSYNITVTNEQPELGKLNFTGVKTLKYGKSLTIKATPLNGLSTAEISVDGNVIATSSLPGKTALYKLFVDGEHTISVRFF